MTLPLALVFYERLLPGTQVVNHLQDLGYRVHILDEPDRLADAAREHSPMLVVADLQPARRGVLAAITRLRSSPSTAHLPVLAFSQTDTPEVRDAAQRAGATLVVQDQALLNHMPQMLEQVLHVE
jgi:CheY-like chemotaxis protein